MFDTNPTKSRAKDGMTIGHPLPRRFEQLDIDRLVEISYHLFDVDADTRFLEIVEEHASLQRGERKSPQDSNRRHWERVPAAVGSQASVT